MKDVSLLPAKLAARVALNAKSLAIRFVGISIRIVPFRAAVLNGLAVVAGLLLMFLRIGQWSAIAGFARRTGSPLPAPLYLLKYFIQQGRDGVWGHVFCEAPSALNRYVTVHNGEAIEHAIARGKGAVLLGAHYGPALYAYVLNRVHFDVKSLLSKRHSTYLREANTLALKPLRSKKITFLNDPGRTAESKKGERLLVDQIRKGGIILTHIDFPGPKRNRETLPLFGLSIRPHTFPFRLALRYAVPVFFCLFDNTQSGGYRLNIIPCGEYTTPEEGFQRYLSCLQVQIEKNPFMWGQIPHFLYWAS